MISIETIVANIVAIFVGFVITSILTPPLIRSLLERRIVAPDVYKQDRPTIPKMGGIAVLSGFVGSTVFSGLFDVSDRLMLSILLASLLGFILGLADDLINFNKKSSVLLTLLLGIPLIVFGSGSTLVELTPVGPLDLGIWFWLIVPLILSFMINGVNIYAGLNGLEAGLGLVTSLSLGICAILYRSFEAAFALFALAGTLLAFLRWNKYPSKIFLGNCGTYLIGAVLASSILAGTIRTAGAVACFPYLINFVLRARGGFSWMIGEVQPSGLIVSKKIDALKALFMYRKPIEEKLVVKYCWLLQIMFGIFAIVTSYYYSIRIYGE